MKTFKASQKTRVTVPKTAGLRKVVVRKSSKAASEKAAYEEYLRKWKIACAILDNDEKDVTKAIKLNIERLLAKRAAAQAGGLV